MALTKEAQAVVDAFGTESGVTAQQLQNLKSTIDASPALTQEINDVVAQGHLQRIVPLNNPHAGGEYNPDGKEMRLPLAILTTPAGGTYSSGEATFILGHELQHGLNMPDMQRAEAAFDRDAEAVASRPRTSTTTPRPSATSSPPTGAMRRVRRSPAGTPSSLPRRRMRRTTAVRRRRWKIFTRSSHSAWVTSSTWIAATCRRSIR